ncbi:hypothetical protein P8452_61464 [Trifolium repens]|nr:hypothetical protein P8452_61464 [Trifolium repens]
MHLISEMAESVGNGNLPVESNVDGVPNANQLEEAQPQLGVEEVDASTSESKIEEVKKKLYMLFDKYTTKRTAAGSTEAPSSMDSATKSFSHNLIHGLKVHNHKL